MECDKRAQEAIQAHCAGQQRRGAPQLPVAPSSRSPRHPAALGLHSWIGMMEAYEVPCHRSLTGAGDALTVYASYDLVDEQMWACAGLPKMPFLGKAP